MEVTAWPTTRTWRAARWALAELDAEPVEQKMFGGLAFMVRGHMTVGLLGDDLMVRVTPAGTADDADLRAWVQRGLDVTETLTPK